MKKVSVVIPAYNNADLTVQTVESVLNQTYKNIEVIVVDDGSTDNTGERLVSYADRIKYVHKKNGGASSARNLGIRLATGEYIGLLDCDDMYLPQKIEKSVDYLERNPDFSFIHTPGRFIDKEGKPSRTYPFFKRRQVGWIAKRLLSRSYICNSTVVVRKACFEKVGFFDESIFIPADWDMWLRLAENYKAGYIDEPLTLYRESGRYTLTHLEQSKREGLVVLEKAFRRNPELSSHFKDRLISNIYFWNGFNYLKINDFCKAKNELVSSIRKDMFNLKAVLCLTATAALGKNLNTILKCLKIF